MSVLSDRYTLAVTSIVIPYGISSLAGLCEGSNGHVLAFAIMDSEMSVLDARVLQRKLCEALVK